MARSKPLERSSKPTDRKAERNLTILVAVIAAVSALLGSAIGGGVAYLTNKQQSESQRQQARADYLAGQRVPVYLEMVKKDNALHSAATDLWSYWEDSGEGGSAETKQQLSDATKQALYAFSEAQGEVVFFGSPKVRAASAVLAQALEEFVGAETAWVVLGPEKAAERGYDDFDFDVETRKIERLRGDFVNAIRDELRSDEST